MPNEFITSRGGRGYSIPQTAKEMEAEYWYNMWGKKLWPFNELSKSDILYWYDSKNKTIAWQSRIRMLERSKYLNKHEAKSFLKKHGADDTNNSYFDGAADQGYCILFRVDILGECDFEKPTTIDFPRNGWFRGIDARKAGWPLDYSIDSNAPEQTLLILQQAKTQLCSEGYYDPRDADSEIKKVLREITQRQGQPLFRRNLLAAYSGRCAITGCDAIDALEAAHIAPYAEQSSNRVSNGLLLRADIHTLFDLNLIGIDPTTHKVVLAPVLLSTSLNEFHGTKVQLPQETRNHPEKSALTLRWKRFCEEPKRKKR